MVIIIKIWMIIKDGDLDEEVGILTENQGPDPKSADAFHLIHPNEVLKALRAFVEENRQPIE